MIGVIFIVLCIVADLSECDFLFYADFSVGLVI